MAFLQDKKKIFTHGRKTEIAISEELEQIRFCDFLKLNRLMKFINILNRDIDKFRRLFKFYFYSLFLNKKKCFTIKKKLKL